MQEHADKLEEWFDESTFEEFQKRVEQQTQKLADDIRGSVLSNDDFTIGLELEVYAVDENDAIRPLSDDVLADAPFNPELGLHNAELNSAPTVFDEDGIATQAAALQRQLGEANTFLQQHGCRLILDSIWTIHTGDSRVFLTEQQEERNGFHFTKNMRSATRYHALDNAFVEAWDGDIPLNVPGADHAMSSILFECLATSIQPHLQVPDADDFATYYNTAIRTMAPLLALAANSPFLPPDMYNRVDDPMAFVDETFHELRIPIFEQAVNTGHSYEEKKVRFPQDLRDATDAATYVEEDQILAPSLHEWGSDAEIAYRNDFWEWDFKRKTFWRWIRPVIGADPVDGANDEQAIRIEYRPLPTQPTMRDIVAMQVTALGAIHGLARSDHPVTGLDWDTAKDDFYRAVDDGLDADLHWITAGGEQTTDKDEIFADVFRAARDGLADRGLSDSVIDRYVSPIEARWKHRTAPSNWKKERVRENLADGASLEDAVHAMQRAYIQKTQETDCFTEWL